MVMAGAHLRAGHDVIVPQYLGRLEFIDTLDQLAQGSNADFVEVLLSGTKDDVSDRFGARRGDLEASGEPHPQADLEESVVRRVLADSFERLTAVRLERTRTHVIDATDELAEVYQRLCRVLDGPDSSRVAASNRG